MHRMSLHVRKYKISCNNERIMNVSKHKISWTNMSCIASIIDLLSTLVWFLFFTEFISCGKFPKNGKYFLFPSMLKDGDEILEEILLVCMCITITITSIPWVCLLYIWWKKWDNLIYNEILCCDIFLCTIVDKLIYKYFGVYILVCLSHF